MVREVTLREVLASKEQRVARRQALLEAHGRPVMQVTLVTPGPLKDFPEAHLLMDEALRSILAGLQDRQWLLLEEDAWCLPTGPDALLAVMAPCMALKTFALTLEEEHPLGRFWDLDIVDPLHGAIGRSALGLPPRTCFLCGEEARACARSRRHPLETLLSHLKEKVHAHAR